MSNYNKFLKNFLIPDDYKKKLETSFELMDKLENREHPILSDTELRYFLSEAKKHPAIEHFLINRYGYNFSGGYTEKQIDMIIDYFNEKDDARGLSSLLSRYDLREKNIDRILFICEAMGLKIGPLLKEQKVSSDVINYLFDTKTLKDMRRMEFAPFEVCTSRDIGKACEEMMNAEVEDESFTLAVTNNRYFPTEIRNKAFDLGCDVTKIKDFTEHAGHQTYISAADCGFELEYKFHNATKVDEAMKVIKNNIEQFPSECMVDLIQRIRDTKKHEYLLPLIANTREEPIVLNSLLELKDDKIDDIIKKKRTPEETTYVHFVSDGKTPREEVREIFLKMWWYRHRCDTRLCNIWMDKNNQDMLKAILMKFDLPRDVIDNIKKYANEEVLTIINIRDNLVKSGITERDIINSYRYFVIKTMGGTDICKLANQWFQSNKRPIITDEPSTKFLIKTAEYEIKKCTDAMALSKLLSANKKLEERYSEEAFLCGRKIRCFKGLRDGYTFSIDSIKDYNQERYTESIENIKKIDNEKVLLLLREEMLENIGEVIKNEDNREVDYVLYKSEKIYQAIDEQLQKVQEKNRESKYDEPLTAEQESLINALVEEATGR